MTQALEKKPIESNNEHRCVVACDVSPVYCTCHIIWAHAQLFVHATHYSYYAARSIDR